MAVNGFAGSEIRQLEKLADFDIELEAEKERRRALDPFNGLFARFHLDDPVAGDELLGFGERAVHDGALIVLGEFDSNALGAWLQPGEIEQYAAFISSSLYLPIVARSSSLGITPA